MRKKKPKVILGDKVINGCEFQEFDEIAFNKSFEEPVIEKVEELNNESKYINEMINSTIVSAGFINGYLAFDFIKGDKKKRIVFDATDIGGMIYIKWPNSDLDMPDSWRE